ncbi:MAG TPA: PAS domain-containing protein, partial [Candidatus Hydrogenedentes bacterium]|nr:PAS domain-containing protein [Candidatus Hydrogenedentota bacterium]
MTTDPKSSSGWLPFQVAFVYAVFGVLWISLSDALVARLAPSQRALVYIQTYKGWFFVAVTALLVFGLVRTHVSKIRRAQEILKSREDLLRQGLEGAQEGVWSWNIRTGELVVDERVVRALGYEVGELAPSPETWDRLLHPEDAERARTALAAFQAGETTYYHMEYRIQRKDGEWQWISSHGKVVERGPAGEPLRATGTIRDIAERKKAELALRESELRLRGVLNYAPVIVFALDKDGVFTFSEGRGLDSLGLRPGELVGQSAFEVYQDNPGIVEHIRMALAGRAFRSTVDVGFISFEVRYAPLRDASGQVEGTIGVALDVSERKRAAEILENVELEKATILDSITDHVCLLDRSLNVLWPNQAACAFAGLPREELIGRPWREAWPKAWPPSEESPVEIAMATERTCEKTFEAADGRVWHVHGYPVRNASGNVVSGLELARDISDQRRAEEEQSRLESHLRRVQRMEAIGTLAGGIAHDFNNALAAIFGYTEIAAEELPEDSPLRGDLARVTVAAERARDLIQQILAFSRGDEQE